ncbi:hypothetical protein SAY87_012811 [Trapa incisa]|uniref:Uncharacterized protein n=1 Tax=Trapa incisa TaxID=236973 RepID=A0AAN7JJ56_9MYRT|nr:hypothetical protein SAY87_012811 [Trapa incisa]
MSLNCLTCQSHQTTDPDLEDEKPKERLQKRCFPRAGRNWSGSLKWPFREATRDGEGGSEAPLRKRQNGNNQG